MTHKTFLEEEKLSGQAVGLFGQFTFATGIINKMKWLLFRMHEVCIQDNILTNYYCKVYKERDVMLQSFSNVATVDSGNLSCLYLCKQLTQ